ncbi:hypothetical protein QCA50_019868 [Cerrena zonata]|uniref:Uncharacterized protein n=1 Tax=Cerrena zonata TaxID=2478898 RepID=A0AAW0FCW8_9APHY
MKTSFVTLLSILLVSSVIGVGGSPAGRATRKTTKATGTPVAPTISRTSVALSTSPTVTNTGTSNPSSIVFTSVPVSTGPSTTIFSSVALSGSTTATPAVTRPSKNGGIVAQQVPMKALVGIMVGMLLGPWLM